MIFYKNLNSEKERLVIGGMSGTSSDGITFSLVKLKGTGINKKIKFIGYIDQKYPEKLRDDIFSLYPGHKFNIENLATTQNKLMNVFADTIAELVDKYNISINDISLISFQGPILFYNPPLCIEMSEPAIIALKFNTPVVSNLRANDIAVGGRGAPLSSYVDYLLFHDREKGRIVQNIGGIANLTAIFPTDKIDDIISFDTGPGNMIIDYVVKDLTGNEYDENGKIALSGKVNKELLDWLMEIPYINSPPPKTTGRELFGDIFGEKVIKQGKRLGTSWKDIITTVTAFTVESIVTNYEKFVFTKGKIDEVILGGGGVFNKALVGMLKKRLPTVRILTHEAFGISSHAREGLTWAVIGDETMFGIPTNLPHITGASKKVLQGKLTL